MHVWDPNEGLFLRGIKTINFSGDLKAFTEFESDPIIPLYSVKLSSFRVHFLGSKYFNILHEHFRDMGGAVLGGGGGHTFRDMGGVVLRYGRCCVGGAGGQKFRDMGGAVSRYGRGCVWGWEDKNFEIWEVLF